MTREPIALAPERLLILYIVEERHPAATPLAELKTRYLQLIREHGTVEKAVAAMREKRRGLP